MNDMKNQITICWNKSQYINEIKSQLEERGYVVNFYTDPSFFDNFNNNTKHKDFIKNTNYIIVLCELNWSLDSDKDQYSNINGIKLVQHIRLKDITVPVLFVSFLSQKDILAIRKDAIIISTQALKHEFIQLPSMVSAWINKLSGMENLTGLELEYTREKFCNLEGLIRHIYHDISSCYSIEALNNRFDILKFVIDSKYEQNKPQLIELKAKLEHLDENKRDEVNEIKDCFRRICDKIIYNRTL